VAFAQEGLNASREGRDAAGARDHSSEVGGGFRSRDCTAGRGCLVDGAADAAAWDEYIEEQPEGYRYSRFCELYRGWEQQLSVTMRQTHASGDKLFVDYAGDTVPVIVDRLTGEIRAAQIFVAAMGASNFTYAEARWTQGLGDWIGAHARAFAAIGGIPNLLVPDNTKVAVIKACLYEPQVNRSYAEMAAHYKCAVLPARPRRPRDKAKSLPSRRRGSRLAC
jgi:transposase